MIEYHIATTINGQETTLHVRDRREDKRPRIALCFEYPLLDIDAKTVAEWRYANCVEINPAKDGDPFAVKDWQTEIAAWAAARVADWQAAFDGRYEAELERVDAELAAVPTLQTRKTELEAKIAEKLTLEAIDG